MLHKENTPLKRAFPPRLTEVGASCPAALVKNAAVCDRQAGVFCGKIWTIIRSVFVDICTGKGVSFNHTRKSVM